MKEELIDAIELCLTEIKKGATIAECLQNHPELADDLRPYLEVAVAARSLSVTEVSPDVINRSRTRLLGYAAQLRIDKPVRNSFMRFPLIVFSALIIALVLILGSRELLVVSAESLPGDGLYPFKRAVQNIRIRLAPNREVKHEIETQYRGQRIEEVVDLLAVGRIEMVSFDGVVDQITPTRWTIDGITVIISEKTTVFGDISLGSLIEVEGLTTIGGWIEAHELHLREYEYLGQVESIEFDFWNIANVKFEIVPSTQIYSGAQVGDEVLVLARTRDDGSQYALAIIQLPSYMKTPSISNEDVSILTAGKNAGEELEFSGNVEFISSSYWLIDGYTVMISLLTEVKEDINLGDFVKVHALIGEDGSLIAREVELGSDNNAHDMNDDDLEGKNIEDEQEPDDDSDINQQDDDTDQGGDQGELSDSGQNGEDESDDDDGGKEGSDDSANSGPEDDSGGEDSEGNSDDGSGSDDDNGGDDGSGSDDESNNMSESDDGEVEDNEDPNETEVP